MEKSAVLGELLYVGLSFEKAYCRSSGFWRIGYKKSLYKHIVCLKQIVESLNRSYNKEYDLKALNNLYELCSFDKRISRAYPFKCRPQQVESYSDVGSSKINELMNCMVNDIIHILESNRIDKNKVHMLLRALHNLPRCYLGKEKETICMLRFPQISINDALQYSYDNMDDITKAKYQGFFE